MVSAEPACPRSEKGLPNHDIAAPCEPRQRPPADGEGALLSTIIEKEVIRTFDTADEVLHTLVRCFGIVVISDSDSKDDASGVDFHFL